MLIDPDTTVFLWCQDAKPNLGFFTGSSSLFATHHSITKCFHLPCLAQVFPPFNPRPPMGVQTKRKHHYAARVWISPRRPSAWRPPARSAPTASARSRASCWAAGPAPRGTTTPPPSRSSAANTCFCGAREIAYILQILTTQSFCLIACLFFISELHSDHDERTS